MKLIPGTVLQVGEQRVVVDRFLAEGGLAHVYLVRLESTNEIVVLKTVSTSTSEGMRCMQNEVQYMKMFTGHKNIVRFIDAEFVHQGGQHALILMEYCPGGHVVDVMNRRLHNRLKEPEILKIFGDACEGVARMHYAKPPVIHRDLKVENLLLSASNDFKLCDFGSATTHILPPRSATFSISKAELDVTHEDVQKHTTVQYRAPELCDVYMGRGINEAVDIWALGVMLYKLCYYTTPFEKEGVNAIMHARYRIPPEPVFSKDLINMIRWCLKENPQDRPNIYQLVKEICRLRALPVPIENIYPDRTPTPAVLPPPPQPSGAPPMMLPNGLRPMAMPGATGQYMGAGSMPMPQPMRRGRVRPTSTSAIPNAQLADGMFQPFPSPVAPGPRMPAGNGSPFPAFEDVIGGGADTGGYPPTPGAGGSPTVAYAPMSPFGPPPDAQQQQQQQQQQAAAVYQQQQQQQQIQQQQQQQQQQAAAVYAQRSSPPVPQQQMFASPGSMGGLNDTFGRLTLDSNGSSAGARSPMRVPMPMPMPTPGVPYHSQGSLNVLDRPMSVGVTGAMGATAATATGGGSSNLHRRAASYGGGSAPVPSPAAAAAGSYPSVTSTPSPLGGPKSSMAKSVNGSANLLSVAPTPTRPHRFQNRLAWLDRYLQAPRGFRTKYLTRIVTESWRCAIVHTSRVAWWQDRLRQSALYTDPLVALRALCLVHTVLRHASPALVADIVTPPRGTEPMELARAQFRTPFHAREKFVALYAGVLLAVAQFHVKFPKLDGSYHVHDPAKADAAQADAAATGTSTSTAATSPYAGAHHHHARPQHPDLSNEVKMDMADGAKTLLESLAEYVLFAFEHAAELRETGHLELFHAMILVLEEAFAVYMLYMYLLSQLQGSADVRLQMHLRSLDATSHLLGHLASATQRSVPEGLGYAVPAYRPSTDVTAKWVQPASLIPKVVRRLIRRQIDPSALADTRVVNDRIQSRPEYGSVYSAPNEDFPDSSDSDGETSVQGTGA
ncbi:NAK/BIKE protein kinase [Allomyces macrogynus ATCC 38327]|uniref:non-specific serine/threonine protein kinase n=1 Tax=Allomyces macrogynus (strain ATCC 38327) TaxID=578462 RepID=A0A0L0SNV9_ALLM3|nr:NAK/BIKE protein kinase [Allomyces macrogynus ATCC 38327]|eukprot:KNE64050.1 NAK/BIKE protein kinase [Allomyces macrogynus ATCC 38327]